MQSSPDAPFGAWQTFRTGLSVAQQKALAIIVLAVVCRFITSQAVAGIGAFADTLGISLPPEAVRALVFVVSLPLMLSMATENVPLVATENVPLHVRLEGQ